MMHLTSEQAIERTLKDIEEYNNVNALLPAIKKVFQQFDGKVYNKRLKTALQEIDSKIYVNQRETMIEIYMYSSGSSYNQITIAAAALPTTRYYEFGKNSFLTSDKRIDASKALEEIERYRVERLKEANEFRAFLENYEEYKKQLEIIKKQVETITSNIPYRMRSYFNMGYMLKNY